MNIRPIVAAAAIAAAGAFSTGCMSMMLANAPTTRSFEDPPVRDTVDPFPKETLVGKWEATGNEDMFLNGKRVIAQTLKSEADLNEDGTCTVVETKTIADSQMGGAGYGMRRSQEHQMVSEGTWDYNDGILSMDLSTEVKTGFISRKLQFKLEYTVAWHSDEEFSLRMTDEQFAANSRSMGSGLGWDSRTVEPNGVETYVKKGFLTQPDQKAVSYTGPYKRIGDAEE